MTHLSLTDVSTLLAHNAVDNGPMVEPLDKCTTTSAHKRVLQRTEQNPVQFLHIMLICPLWQQDNKKVYQDIYCVPISYYVLAILSSYSSYHKINQYFVSYKQELHLHQVLEK